MSEVPRFARRFFDPEHRLTRLGEGELGGKAEGLVRAQAVLSAHGTTAPSLPRCKFRHLGVVRRSEPV